MKKICKSLGIIAILFLSFYYTEKIAIIMQNKSPIMQNINLITPKYKEEAVSAKIEDIYITPGIMGKMVNKNKSYVNMKSFGVFNEYYLIFEDIKPDISLEDNKDKIIKKANASKNAIGIILEDGNSSIKNYFIKNNINADLLITEKTYDKNNFFEQINSDKEKYRNVESLLNKNNQNKNICFIKTLDISFCQKEQKYLVSETFSLTNSNIIDIKKNISSGSIIYINKDTSIDNIKLVLKEINFKGLKVLPISLLIEERR